MTDRNVLNSPDLKHFLQLANAGADDNSTNIEAAADELAYCVLHNVPGFDESALRGLCAFIGLAKLAPSTARDLLE